MQVRFLKKYRVYFDKYNNNNNNNNNDNNNAQACQMCNLFMQSYCTLYEPTCSGGGQDPVIKTQIVLGYSLTVTNVKEN